MTAVPARPSEPLSFAKTAALLTVFAAALYVPWLGASGLEGIQQHRRALVARSLVERGDWVVPTFRGEPYLNKPPLHPWLVGATFLLLGEGDATARIPSVLSGILFVLSTAALARLVAGRGPDLLAGAAAATFFMAYREARTVDIDILVAALSTLATVFLVACIRREDGRWRALQLASLATLGLAAMAKGPLGIFFPAVGCAAEIIAGGRPRRALRVLWPPGVLLFFAVALPWPLLVLHRIGGGAVEELLGREVGSRFTAASHHPEAPWFYLARCFDEGLPATLPLLFLPWVFRSLAPERRAALKVAGIAFGLAVLCLSIPTGKRMPYLLPAYAWVGVAAGVTLESLLGEAHAAALRFRSAVRVAGLLALPLAAAGVAAVGRWFPDRLPAAALAGAAALPAAWTALRWPRDRAAPVILAAVAAIALFANSAVIEPLRDAAELPREFFIAIGRLVPPDAALATLQVRPDAVEWYAHRRAAQLDCPDAPSDEAREAAEAAALAAFAGGPGERFVLLRAARFAAVAGPLGLLEVARCPSFEKREVVLAVHRP